MLRGDVRVWLQANGWKLVKKRWVKAGFVLWVESSAIDPDRLTWLLTAGKARLDAGSGVIETLYKTLNRFD